MRKPFLAFVFLTCFAAAAQTVVNPVNVGTAANDHTGDPLRTAMQKLNANDANLNSGKLEVTNPVVHGTLTGDQFGELPIGDSLKIGGAGKIQGFANIITGPTHSWFTLEITPTASGDPLYPSSVIIHSPLSATKLNANTFGDWNGFTGYEWQHADGSFSFDKPGTTNKFSGLLTDTMFYDFLTFTNPATGPANAFHVGGQFVITGGPGEVDVQLAGGTANGSAAVVNFSADNLNAGTDVGAANNVNAGNNVTAGNQVSVAGGSSSLGALTLTLGGATIAQTTQSATSPTRGWRQVNFGFFVSPTGPTNNVFIFDAETLFKGAGDYAGYEWLHQDGSVSFDKAGTTNHFRGLVSGTSDIVTNTGNTAYFSTVGGATSWGAGTLYTNGPNAAIFRMDISSTSGGSGSANQVFFHYTNNATGRLRQAFFTLLNGSVNVQPMQVELDPGATFRIDTIVSTSGSLSFINQTLSSR